MKTELKTLLIDVCFWIISICIIFFFFVLLIYSHNLIDNPLKEAFSLTLGLISALSTIGAAIIAAYLFNDWKVQHNKSMEVQLALIMIEKFELFDEQISLLYGQIAIPYDHRDQRHLELAVNDFKEYKQNKLLEIRISFLKASASIENFYSFSGDDEEVKYQLKMAKSAFKKFSDACLNIDNDSSYTEVANRFVFAFSELIPVINYIEENYIQVAIKNLRA
ncbi:TPA: hypothetical protein OMQ61_001141 [Acinetobacter baumannii]|uniref:hypothetical protein n=1 Tax=Acinetobacter baumannii TaxID=470 RepID=UPI0010217E50|nr:hypothetical protein [Acinetobacter baumannii]MDR9625252.1 hypothetical protein [Acinetobacter baumannii]HCJ0464166.1 hypothetical protein [Acinetobacter baumannii]HCQ9866751.1 hypothetical protein [Acinetobacter baumannii]